MNFIAGWVDLTNRPQAIFPYTDNSRGKTSGASVWRNERACVIHCGEQVTEEAERHKPQPLMNSTQSVVLVFNGRLDDRVGLCASLGIPAADTSPDSRLALRAYERWGTKAAEHLIGDFAIAAFEPGSAQLWLAVSPKGFRVLYYHRRNGLVAFSTHVPWLLDFPGVSRALDECAIADFLAVNHDDSEQTYYRDVLRVCPGTSVTLPAGGPATVESNWEPGQKGLLRLRDAREYVEAARETLDRVVASHLRCDGEVAIMGSGGLDTSCIAVSAAGLPGAGDIRLVTVRPEEGTVIPAYGNSYTDEAPHVAVLAGALPKLRPASVQPLRTTDLESDPERIFESSALMIRNVMQIAWLESAWRHLAETGTRAFVDGSNGNFTLTWDGLRGLSDMFWTGRWLRLASYVVLRGRPNPRAGLRDVWRNVVIPSVPPSMRRVRWQDNSSLRGDAAAAFDVVGRMQRRGNDPSWVGAQSSLQDRIIRIKRNRVFFAEYHSWMSAKYGVEPRFPLMDVRLIDFCLSLPVHVYLRDGRPRALARDLLVAAGLPRAFAERQARGRMCPEWFARLERRRPKIEMEIAAIRKLPLAAKMIDFERIDRIMADWPVDAETAKRRNLELDILLTRALHVGAFIGWAEKRSLTPVGIQM